MIQQNDFRESYRCLLITTGFFFTAPELKGVAIIGVTFATVVIWKLVTGDWSVAAGFGSLIVGLIGVVSMEIARNQSVKAKQT